MSRLNGLACSDAAGGMYDVSPTSVHSSSRYNTRRRFATVQFPDTETDRRTDRWAMMEVGQPNKNGMSQLYEKNDYTTGTILVRYIYSVAVAHVQENTNHN